MKSIRTDFQIMIKIHVLKVQKIETLYDIYAKVCL